MCEKSELEQVFNLLGRPERGQGHTHPGAFADPNHKDTRSDGRTDLSGLANEIYHGATDGHRKESPSRLTPYEAHTVPLEKQLEGTRITRKGDSHPKVAPHPSKMVAARRQYASRSSISPTANF